MDGPRVGVIGLGSMGYGMATSLVAAGLETHGFDVSADAVTRFAAGGGRSGELGEVASTLDILVVVVVSADQMRAVLLGPDGIADRLKAGAVVLGCITAPPDVAREMEAALEARGLLYLDAPISGGPAKAAEGALSIMAAGRPAAFDAAAPALDAMAATVFRLGDRAGPGSAMKVVNQLLAGVHIAAAAEALTFAAGQGIAPALAIDTLMQCAGASRMLEDRGRHIAQGDYAPRAAIDIWLKDLGIVCDVAREARFPALLASNALQQFLAASSMGLGREDDAAVAKVYAALSDVALPGAESKGSAR